MEKLINSEVFKRESEFEDYFFKILELLLKINTDTNLRDVFRVSPQESYEGINRKLRASSDPISDIKNLLLKEIKKIIDFFDHILNNLNNDEYKKIFLILNPSPKSYTFLVEFHSKFPNIQLHDKSFIWNITCNLKEIFSDKIDAIASKINELESENKKLADFLKSKLDTIRESLNRDITGKKQISVLDFIEVMELSIWKAGREPVSYFRTSWKRAFSSPDPQEVFNAFDFVEEKYRRWYMFDGNVFRYIFMEYERVKNGNESILYKLLSNSKDIEVEHIFVRDASVYRNSFSQFGFVDESNYRDFVYKWGNLTFLEKSLNSSISNKEINHKAEYYRDFCKNGRTSIKDICILGEDLCQIDLLAGREPTPAYRLYLEIRELDIKLFAYKRFSS